MMTMTTTTAMLSTSAITMPCFVMFLFFYPDLTFVASAKGGGEECRYDDHQNQNHDNVADDDDYYYYTLDS